MDFLKLKNIKKSSASVSAIYRGAQLLWQGKPGRNLFRNSALMRDFRANDAGLLNKISAIDIDGPCLFLESEMDKRVSMYGYDLANYTTPGGVYVLSVDVHQCSGAEKSFNLSAYGLSQNMVIVPAYVWKRMSVMFTARAGKYPIVFECSHYDCEIRNWKLERGNKPTPWTPAPEDENF